MADSRAIVKALASIPMWINTKVILAFKSRDTGARIFRGQIQNFCVIARASAILQEQKTRLEVS